MRPGAGRQQVTEAVKSAVKQYGQQRLSFANRETCRIHSYL